MMPQVKLCVILFNPHNYVIKVLLLSSFYR